MRKRGEVYWVQFDPSVGTEIRKRRPAVTVSVDFVNRKGFRYQVIPFTSNLSKVYPSEVVVRFKDGLSKAAVDQIAMVSKERIGRRLGRFRSKEMTKLEEKIKFVLGLIPMVDPQEK